MKFQLNTSDSLLNIKKTKIKSVAKIIVKLQFQGLLDWKTVKIFGNLREKKLLTNY